MRKLFLGIIIMLTILQLAPGCGSIRAEARRYMNEADEILSEQEEKTEAFTRDVESLIAQATSGDLEGATEFEQTLGRVKTTCGDIAAGVENARVEYQRITALPGAEEYVEYANLRIQVADDILRGNEIIAGIAESLEAFVLGERPLDPAELSAAGRELEKLGQQIMENGQSAERLKKEKRL